MSQKQEKKMRKVFRKRFEDQYKKTAIQLATEREHFLKKKPDIIPMWIWVKLLKIFIRINEK
jgi:hypothetical protein